MLTENCSCCPHLMINIPRSNECIRPGYKIRIGRFSTKEWLVLHDWYSWGNNRPVCGWYLVDTSNSSIIKPLQLTDLDDCYLVKQ